MTSIKRAIAPYYRNLFGWRTNRKILVIESDDWGSIRMPSREVYEKCLKEGYRVDENPYEKYDCLLSEDDLELLFELLTSFKDSNGRHPVITANTLAVNPDFYKIRNSGFQHYYYESIRETFKRYPKHSGCFNMWKEGHKEGLFFPQSHGREHLNVSEFMNALQVGNKDVRFGFDHEMPGGLTRGDDENKNRYVEALRYVSPEDKMDKLSIIIEGLHLFEELIGYRSETFIPPNYMWSSDFDEVVSKEGVMFYQGSRKMKEPLYNGKKKLHSFRTGQTNKYGQKYLVRNVLFEPSLFRMNIDDPLANCLRDITIAFSMKKPAIICSHRINYAGFIDEENRDNNLKMMRQLLKEIVTRWPDVEFMNSVQLGHLLSE